jgi:SAM-dependent methyltransferase
MNAPSVYDAVSYPGFAHAQTHPDRLFTIAALFGMTAAPPDRCRILEVGCGDGRNLIAMASALPQSSFVGFDLAAQPIAAGRALAERLGLKNVTLTQQDLMAVTAEIGRFDYVIAHGFYAWVPPPVQDKLLALCRDVLGPEGIAYVSYNAYPGSRTREMSRDVMLYHVRGVTDPSERIAAAKAALDFVRRNMPGASETGSWILDEMERLVRQDPGALYHDTLGEIYRPCTFSDFMQRAGGHGLQYLGEADFLEMSDEPFSPEAVERLRSFGPEQILEKEQLMDHLKMRSFRQTLLCRDTLALRRAPESEDLSRFHVSTRARAVSPPSPSTPPGYVEYRTAKGATMVTDSQLFQRMMERLDRARPGSVPFPELAALCGDAAAATPLILRMYGGAIVELHPTPPRFVMQPGETPALSELVRIQIERSPLVTNRLHADVRIDGEMAKELMKRLDGRRNRETLLRDLAAAGVSLTPAALEAALQQLARLALLTG